MLDTIQVLDPVYAIFGHAEAKLVSSTSSIFDLPLHRVFTNLLYMTRRTNQEDAEL